MSNELRLEAGRPNLPPSQGIFAGGATAGIFAAIVMALFSMSLAATQGIGFWTPMRMIAASLVGVKALVATPAVILLGICLHLGTGAFWGVVFASFVRRSTSAGAAFWAGLLYGVGVWAFMSYIGLPALNRTMEARVAMQPGKFFAGHLLYGACLMVTPALKNRFAERPILRSAQRRETVEV